MGEWQAPPSFAHHATADQPPFVARESQIAVIASAWRAAGEGAGGAVFVSGEPGGGKSRLIAEACARLRASGSGDALILSGACIQELGAPFEPFGEPLRRLLPEFRDERADALSASARDVLERVVEYIDTSPVDAPSVDEGRSLPVVGRERLFDAAIAVFVAASRQRLVVLALDDLHWADPAAIRLLTRLVQKTSGCRILVLATLRHMPPDRSDALIDAMTEVQRMPGVHRVELGPLELDQTVEYLHASAGLDVAHARRSARLLQHLTGGNPFLLREMWKPVVEVLHRADDADTASEMSDREIIAVPSSIGPQRSSTCRSARLRASRHRSRWVRPAVRRGAFSAGPGDCVHGRPGRGR